jgi:pimeloyl-ACP methyl ester carboxylesterase
MNISSIVITTLTLALASLTQSGEPSPPPQPPNGPGGSEYAYARVATTRIGAGSSEVYLFEPADPRPQTAPVVVFAHGWAAMDPNYYRSWLTHIVRRGFTVIVPRYQADVRTPVAEFTSNAADASTRALEELSKPEHVRPDPRGAVYVGHSMGGLIAANLAARATRGLLLPPLALMSVQPGKTWLRSAPFAFVLDDLSVLPSNMLLLTVVGDDDNFVRDVDAKSIFRGATRVAAANKNYIEM